MCGKRDAGKFTRAGKYDSGKISTVKSSTRYTYLKYFPHRLDPLGELEAARNADQSVDM